MSRIVLIAGHGAGDPGARMIDGRWERDLVREDVERLRQIFVHNGVSHAVYLTSRNLFWDMRNNVNNWRNFFRLGDIVAELHLNAFYLKSANGTENFTAFRNRKHAINIRVNNGLARWFRNRGRKYFYFKTISKLKKLVALHILVETCFGTNRNDFDTYIRNRNAILLQLARDLTGNPNLRDVGMPTTPPNPPADNLFPVGTIVQFRGGVHHASSTATASSGAARTAGRARVTALAANARNQYHLVGSQGGAGNQNSNVHGWVQASLVEAVTASPPTQGSFRVRVNAPLLNIRAGAGTNHRINGTITDRGVYTITEVRAGVGSTAGWGRLKSGAGWISLDFATRI